MRRGYSQDIRAEAITKRYQGNEWKVIQTHIAEKFGVKPSIRQMQKWFEDYQGTTDDPTGVKYVAKAIEDSANLAKPLAQAKMMSEVFPLWSHLREQYNMDVLEAGLVAMWLFYQGQVGRDNLDNSYSRYQELRDKLPREPLSWPPLGGVTQTKKGTGNERTHSQERQAQLGHRH